jgi:citrate lyase subunit beta/citryl-CoA lyase
MLQKALDLAVDELVFDLEDAVAPGDKARARALLVPALSGSFRAERVSVRVNAMTSPWFFEDIVAMSGAERPPDTIILPKVEDAAELRLAAQLLAERAPSVRLQALIETARGLRDIGPICASTPVLDAVVLGYADLCASLGRPGAQLDEPAAWTHAQDLVVLHARAANVQAIDGPFLRLDDEGALLAAARWGRGRGFDGKWVIHPGHVAPVTGAFSPDAEELASARSLLEQLAAAEDQGSGAARHGGAMIDEALRKAALHTLARAGEPPPAAPAAP